MKYKYLLLLLSTTPLLLTACGGGDNEGNYSAANINKTSVTTPSTGRLLASQCAQCHGTDGISVSGIEGLAGESGEIYGEMLSKKRSNRNRIMHLQAKGYTDTEIREIAKYFSTLYQGNGGDSDNDSHNENNENEHNENGRREGDDD